VRRPWLLLVVLAIGAASCGGGSSPDARTFCQRLDRLTANDPFQAFGDRATETEVEAAFTALVARAKELLEVAPDDVRAAARDYVEAAEGLDDLLAAAAYDGDQVDARAYRDEQLKYTEAASRLERYLDKSC
jgi:hypothetical protein